MAYSNTATPLTSFINGAFVQCDRSNGVLPVVNPATGETIAAAVAASDAEIDASFKAATAAQRAWGRQTAVQRGDVLRKWASLVERDAAVLAQMLSDEVGKPLSEAQGEVGAAVTFLTYWASWERHLKGETIVSDRPGEKMLCLTAPVGVVVGVVAWNFPLALAVRKAGPALIAGNAIIIKPHELTPIATFHLAKLALEAGVPTGIFSVVYGPGPSVGRQLVTGCDGKHDVGLVTLTGSTRAGHAIAAAVAPFATETSLEMGGKAPFIVLEDADLVAAVDACVGSRMFNCGQVCTCPERVLLHVDIADEFTALLLTKVAALVVGDPADAATVVGPKVSLSELVKVEQLVAEATAAGATVLCGGKRKTTGLSARCAGGFFYEPTVVTDVAADSPLIRSEVFGPVLPLQTFADFDEAMVMANDSNYGLAAFVFTKTMAYTLRACDELEYGEVYINRGMGESVHGFHSGWKQSGIGGDDGAHGLAKFMRRKSVYIAY